MELNKFYLGDSAEVMKSFPDDSIDCIVTSPPYYLLRNYNHKDQIGLESSVEEFICRLSLVMEEVYRVLKPSGTLWINLGDTYGTKSGNTHGKRTKQPRVRDNDDAYLINQNVKPKQSSKSLLLIPFKFAVMMEQLKFKLRNTVIWHKPNALPNTQPDRFTVDFEYVFFYVKEETYYFNPIKELAKYDGRKKMECSTKKYKDGNITYIPKKRWSFNDHGEAVMNKRTVWSIPTGNNDVAHYATYPEELVNVCLEAGCPAGGIVLDPFSGSGTTCFAAEKSGRKWLGIDINEEYLTAAESEMNRVKTVKENPLLDIVDIRKDQLSVFEV